MKYLILIFSLVFTTLLVSPEKSLAQVTCEGSPAADNRAGRKKVKKWDNCIGVQFYCEGAPAEDNQFWGKVRKWNSCRGINLYSYQKNYLKYDGFFSKGKREGLGTEEVLPQSEYFGQKYVGEFKRGKFSGQGKFTYASGEKYVGEWRDEERNGQGSNTYSDGRVLKGIWKDDQLQYAQNNTPPLQNNTPTLKDGLGTLTFTNGTYFGDVKNGGMNGWGTLTLFSGEIQEGEFKNNKLNGQATVTHHPPSQYAGQEYVGMYKDSMKHGKGRLKFPSGEIQDGEFKNDKLNGQGQILLVTGERYVGMFKNNERNGQGTNYFTDGRVQEGIWKDDQFQYAQNNTPQPEARPQITVKKPPDDDKIIPVTSGTGFAVSSDGYVITNHHVIDQCQQVNIHYQGNEIPATVVTYDKQNDLALLKGDFKPETVFSLANNSPGLLQDIYVAGYPFGYKLSSQIKVTKGIISSLTGLENNFSEIQIDAAIQGGNSGGPIVDEMGNLVGVVAYSLNKALYDAENTNFGVKFNLVKNILESNNIKILSENKTIISKPELAKRLSSGTYYISCGMTMALYESLKTQKVFFNHLN
jgi:hypothetical protein